MEFLNETDFDCTVDASITVDAQDNVYQLIQDAIDDDCTNILLKNYENFYTENIEFGKNFKRLYSPDGACILGNQHKLKNKFIDFRGVCFLHPGDESKPLFIPEDDMDSLLIRNCILEGQGVKGGGVLPLNMKKRISELVINNTEISTWNYAIIIAKNIRAFIMTNNWIHDSYGRLFEVRYVSTLFFRRVSDSLFQIRKRLPGALQLLCQLQRNGQHQGCLARQNGGQNPRHVWQATERPRPLLLRHPRERLWAQLCLLRQCPKHRRHGRRLYGRLLEHPGRCHHRRRHV